MSRCLSLFCVIFSCLIAGCGGKDQPSSGGGAPSNDGLDLKAANDTAKEFVAAILAEDAGRLAEICWPPLNELFLAVKKNGQTMTRAKEILEKRFPAEARSEALLSLDRKWRQPMAFLRELKLDGRISDDLQGGVAVYQLSFKDIHSFPTKTELTVRRSGNQWKVASYGKDYTPQSVHVGFLKTEASRYALALEPFIKEIEKRQPARLNDALEIWQSLLPSFENPNPAQRK